MWNPGKWGMSLGVGAWMLCILVAGPGVAEPEPAETEPATQRRYLAVDESLHASLRNMELVMGQASGHTAIWDERADAWERDNDLDLGFVGSVIRDHEGRYRMYYEVMRGNAERATAVAFSDDGVHWEKPALNIAPNIVDHPASNLIHVEPHEGMLDGKWYRGAHAFLDAHAKDPDRRYKLFWRQGHNMYVASSRDGLHFETHGLAVNYYADTMASFFYDPLQDEYAIYGRVWIGRDASRDTIEKRLGADGKPPVRRGVVLHRSPAWEATPWPEETVKDIIIEPMDVFKDGGWSDLYTSGVQVYHGQYVGLPAVWFRHPLEDLSGTAGPLYPIFMHSHDGRNWTFPDKQHPIVDLEPLLSEAGHDDRSDFGQLYTASNFLDTGDRLLVYYWYRAFQHNVHTGVARHGLASMRKDGFASLQSRGENPGEWVTSKIAIPAEADTLYVNADVEDTLRAEVIDAGTAQPIDGLSMEDCTASSGDETRARIEWAAQPMEAAQDRQVQLRFQVIEGKLYSFWFE